MMNEVSSSPLIRVLGWNDFHKTSIEISLPIILHLHFDSLHSLSPRI